MPCTIAEFQACASERDRPFRSFFGRAGALVPFLAERSRATEDNRAALPEVIEALEETGYYQLTRPRRYGGLEAPLAQHGRALATIARGCPSTGWLSSVHSVVIWWISMFPAEVQDEVFAQQNVRAAVAFAPTGAGKPRPGGIVVNGRWAWNTGKASAHWAGLTVMVP
jgi:alkylation response protein AidB-like acyl-CoA dehydrogenase